MKKVLAAALCLVALVGCGGPLEDESMVGQQQQQLVAPPTDGIPTGAGEPTVDVQQLNLDPTFDRIIQNDQQFADQHLWTTGAKPHHCGGK